MSQLEFKDINRKRNSNNEKSKDKIIWNSDIYAK